MNAQNLPQAQDVLADPDEVLLPRLMFDWFETGLLVGIVPQGASRTDSQARAWQKRVHQLRLTNRLPARHYGREWRWSSATIREFVLGHDDNSVSQVAS